MLFKAMLKYFRQYLYILCNAYLLNKYLIIYNEITVRPVTPYQGLASPFFIIKHALN